ncbi:MAG: cytochrome c oxidase subunit 3 [Leptospiraceae bacterium]|nr:cytochrome c oxidase subunit 3 [Leptospiraceae bacterium]
MSEAAAHSHDEHYDPEGTRLGFWLFLFTEIFLFAIFFLMYAVYRHAFLQDFHNGAEHLNVPIGATNTMILLFSSLTVVLSIVAIQKNDRPKAMLFLAISILCGLAFLVIKGFEWNAKFGHDFYFAFRNTVDAGGGSPKLQVGPGMLPNGEILFFGLYFVMTGIHALHIVIGVTLLSLALFWVQQKKITQQRHGVLENFGLYWHLVDLIWIFLFPLFYLIA